MDNKKYKNYRFAVKTCISLCIYIYIYSKISMHMPVYFTAPFHVRMPDSKVEATQRKINYI